MIDLHKVDLNRINQVILENGIYENQPQSILTSDSHTNVYGECIILGYELVRNTKITNQQLLQIVNNTRIPRSLLQNVGNDYFLASISPFQGHFSAFEIDAGKINQRSFLVFVLTSIQSCSMPILFDFEDNFDSSKKNYRNIVRKMILKASEHNIIITGIVTDNLPVQIMGVSHESISSFQNKFEDVKTVIHLRCCNNLLYLAFRDWSKHENDLTMYEKVMKKLISVF